MSSGCNKALLRGATAHSTPGFLDGFESIARKPMFLSLSMKMLPRQLGLLSYRLHTTSELIKCLGFLERHGYASIRLDSRRATESERWNIV